MEPKIQLSSIVDGLLRHMGDLGYSASQMNNFRCTWNDVSHFMSKEKVFFYSPDVGSAYLRFRFGETIYRNLKRSARENVRHVRALSDYAVSGSFIRNRTTSEEVVFKGILGLPFNGFIDYSRGIRRSEGSLSNYKRYLDILYRDLARSNMTVAHIDMPYLIRLLPQIENVHSEVVRNLIIATFRVFLKYLCSQGLLKDNREEYWMSVLMSRRVKQPKVPSVYSTEEIQKVLETIDRGNPVGKRNYAMLLLAVRCGLRISDIIGLRFCNLDWSANRISMIQTKTQRTLILPLSEDVGSAIIDYLKFGRTSVDLPYVFISAIAPYQPLCRSIMHRVISTGLERAGILNKGRKSGPHAFRHSLAANLLSMNEPLPVISKILGHSNIESTSVYLRVDFNQLRKCALEVSCVAPSFYDQLYE